MPDFKIWIDISEGSIGGWIGLSIAIVAALWFVLVLLKLWIIWDNMHDDGIGEHDPDGDPIETEPPRLVLVDRTGGKIFRQGGK